MIPNIGWAALIIIAIGYILIQRGYGNPHMFLTFFKAIFFIPPNDDASRWYDASSTEPGDES